MAQHGVQNSPGGMDVAEPASASELPLSKPLFVDGCYQNPWPTWRNMELRKVIGHVFGRNERNIPKDEEELAKVLPVLKPDLKQFKKSPVGIRHLWIGHATSLIQVETVTFLTDPIFSNRCSPFQRLFGRQRYRPPPCSIEELPPIDFVIISHDHYDHLDYNSVWALNERFGDNLRWYVPLGLKGWMHASGCNNVVEMTWWQEHLHSKNPSVTVVCTPCQHWCKRGLRDDNKALWCSWSVIGPKHKFYFAGDTGYCEAFKEIGQQYGPFTLATIPIGPFKPREFLSPQHVGPEEAIDIHNDVQSQNSVAIHWGTFPQGKEFYLAPQIKLEEGIKKRGMSPNSFVTVHHGEISVFGSEQSFDQSQTKGDE